ncbi:MAG: ABC transporter substrate-binding protein [Bacillota bacterium]
MKRWTRIVSVMILVALLALAAGCGAKPATTDQNSGTPASTAKKKFLIGYDIYFVGNTWSVQMMQEFKGAAERHADEVDVIYTESEGKVDKQIANVEDMIAKKVDAIVITPNSPTAIAPVLEKAADAGIKVILCAAKADTDKYTALVTVNDVDFGKAGAEWLVKKLNGKGNIIALNGIAGISVSDERWQGAKSVFDQYPDIKVVGEQAADWDYAKAKAATASLLAANPKIDGVWSQGGEMTLGAIEAFQAANRPLVPMTAEDNNGFLKKWKELQPNGFSAVAASKPTWLSAESLEVALKALKGEPITKDNYLPAPTITDENLDQFVRPDLPDSFWTQTKLTDDQIKALFQK